MKLNDIIRLSMNNLTHRKLRSWLTILGIVIGVAAVVSIVSIGSGTQQLVSSQLGDLGADIITISPGFSRAQGMMMGGGPAGGGFGSSESSNLTERDLQVIKSVSGVEFVNGIITGTAEVSYLAQTVDVNVNGVDPLAWSEITTSEMESGRFLTAGDGNVVIISSTLAQDVFKQELLINARITIEGKSFKIVGILESSDTMSFGRGGGNTVYMPITAARTILDDLEPDQFSSIQVKVSDADLVNQTTENIEAKLMLSRHVTDETKDFTISSSQAMQETISSVMSTLNMFLTGIAAISLLVGAVGIANTMFMSVMERTRQIGVLKSLGTTNFEVMKMFVVESALIGFIGGLIGVFLGFIGSGIVSELSLSIMGSGMRGSTSITLITPELIIFSILFSVVIGALSGLLPARRAAQLQPVEALRYE